MRESTDRQLKVKNGGVSALRLSGLSPPGEEIYAFCSCRTLRGAAFIQATPSPQPSPIKGEEIACYCN